MVMNFSMYDLKRGRRFYDSSIEETTQPRQKLVNSLESRQFDEETYKNIKGGN